LLNTKLNAGTDNSMSVAPPRNINYTIFRVNKKESNYCFSKKNFAAALREVD